MVSGSGATELVSSLNPDTIYKNILALKDLSLWILPRASLSHSRMPMSSSRSSTRSATAIITQLERSSAV